MAEALATWSPTYRDQTKRLTAEETDVLARALQERKGIIYGRCSLPPKQAEAAQTWKDIAAIFTSSSAIIRAPAQCRKRHNDVWRQGKKQNAAIRQQTLATGGQLTSQDLTPAEDNPKVLIRLLHGYSCDKCQRD